MRDRAKRGFTIVEMLAVVVTLGVVSAISIPTLLNALDRGRQKRTMADLHTLGLGIQAYVVDQNLYPAGSSIADLVPLLGGEYLAQVPLEDGWSHRYVYSGDAVTGYTIGSTGKDGGTALTLLGTGGPTVKFSADIIYSNGSFVQWPVGAQTD